jgi:hypothetical protein
MSKAMMAAMTASPTATAPNRKAHFSNVIGWLKVFEVIGLLFSGALAIHVLWLKYKERTLSRRRHGLSVEGVSMRRGSYGDVR